MLETRRRGQLFEPQISDDSRIFAHFGTIAEVSSRTECPSCRDLAQEITRWENEDHWTRTDHLLVGIHADDHEYMSNIVPDQPLYVVTQDPTQEDGGCHLVNLYPLERGGAPQDEWGRLFDTSQFDIEMVKGWLQCCDLSHGEYCKASLTHHLPADTFPSRILLIDLERQCLSYGTLLDKYIALSYVWGKAHTLRTTRSILSSLLKPGSIDFKNKDLMIPESIRDFLRLAVRLGIRYAWVDSLCIVQDGEDLQEQLYGMAAIFASTYLTVVGEGIDANHGLLGVGLGSKSRDTPCLMLRLPDMTCVFKDNTVPSNRTKVWEQRAWTFQEGLFSRRLLIFDSAGMLTWKCPRLYWYETHVKPSEAPDWIVGHQQQTHADWRYIGFSKLTSKWPDMRRWCELAQEYYTRVVSFDSDASNAIAGLMAVMEKMSPGGFFHGLPELFFDIFLLWDVNGPSQRIDCNDIPSWSFLGWKGGSLDVFWWRFSMDHTFINQPDNGFGSDCEIGSIVEWFKKSRDRTVSVPILNKFHEYRSQPIADLPEGWTKHKWEEDGKVYFTHESIDDFEFRYPIVLPQEKTRSEEDKFSQDLRFKANRGWLNIGSLIELSPEDIYDDSGPQTSSLNDRFENWAGVIRLHSSKPAGSEESIPESRRVELIAIATGKVRNDAFPKQTDFRAGSGWMIPEWGCEQRPKDEEFYEFYFVLSIDWHGDVAQRTGLGRVDKKAWERLPLDVIEVTLG